MVDQLRSPAFSEKPGFFSAVAPCLAYLAAAWKVGRGQRKVVEQAHGVSLYYWRRWVPVSTILALAEENRIWKRSATHDYGRVDNRFLP